MYLDEHHDAEETAKLVSEEGGRCLRFAGDVADESFCRRTVTAVAEELGGLDILVNNAAEQVESFGQSTPLGRPGQPDEVAPCYVFLASDDARYMSGQVLHPNGGQVVGG